MSQPLSWSDFSGGITDNLFHNAQNKYYVADNLFVNNDKKIVSRPGSTVLDTSEPSVGFNVNGAPANALTMRVDRMMKFFDESYLFLYTVGFVFFWNGPGLGWSGLVPPNGANTFFQPDHNTPPSWSEYVGQLLVTQGSSAAGDAFYNYPIRFWVNSIGTWNAAQMGLPPVPQTLNYVPLTATQNAITLANGIRTSLIGNGVTGHFGDTTNHLVADTVSGAGIPGALSDTGNATTNTTNIIAMTKALMTAYINHYRDFKIAGLYHYKETLQPTVVSEVPPATQLLPNTVPPATLQDACARLNELKVASNAHQGNADIHTNGAGLGSTTTAAAFLDNSVVASPKTVTSGPLLTLDFAAVYAYANKIKTQYNLHLADGGTVAKAHSTAADATNNVTVANATTPETLQALLNSLYVKYSGGHEVDAQKNAAWSFHVAKEATNHQMTPAVAAGGVYTIPPVPDLFEGFTAGDWPTLVTWMNTFKNVLNLHMADLTAHYTNKPATYAGSTFAANQVPGADMTLATYNYVFIYVYSFQSGSRTFRVQGPTTIWQYPNVLSIDYQPAVITNIPVLTNVVTRTPLYTNYDTSNITVEIYRTQNAGNVYYLTGTIANGTTTFTDVTPDTSLINQKQLYTTGGQLDSWQPPACACLHVSCGVTYYGNVLDTDGVTAIPNRILQAVKDAPDWVPTGNICDLDDAVIGVSSAKDTVVAFCGHSLYRLDGTYDSQGRGGIAASSISRTVGCLSEASIVKSDLGCFFAGTDGFYYTDGYSILKLSKHWNATYQALIANTPTRIVGAFDTLTKRIWWGVQRLSANSDNDACFVLDLNYGINEDMPWTTLSNGAHWNPTGLVFYQKHMIRADKFGLIFKHDAQTLTDPYINQDVNNPAVGSDLVRGTQTIRFDFQSLQTDLGDPSLRKEETWLIYQLRNETSLNMAAYCNIDDLRLVQAFTPLAFTTSAQANAALAGGNPNLPWTSMGLALFKRRFPATTLRSTYHQIRYTNNYVTLYASANYSTATVATGSPNTFTLTNGALSWPSDVVGYFVALAGDGYVRQYEIIRRFSNTVIHLADPGSHLVNGASVWQINGYPKSQKLHLVSYSVLFQPVSPSFTAARSPTT